MMEIYQKISLGAKLFLLTFLVSTNCVAATETTAGFDDWIISGSCRIDANKLCEGYYLQPKYPKIDPATEDQLPVTVKSDEASFISKGTSEFTGKVVASQGTKFIYASKAEVAHNYTLFIK